MPAASSLVLALIAAMWLVVAVAVTLIGLRRTAAARHAADDMRAMAGLIAASPSAPMLAHRDGRIEIDTRIADWLAIDHAPARISDLAGGTVTAADIALIERAIAATLATGAPFDETIALGGGRGTLAVQGAPYSAPSLARQSVLVWFTNVSSREGEIARLTAECDRLSRSLASLSTLIEAAPFPMWHRGPDYKLALVNLAYVRAVEARDAADVVRRGLELIEAGAEGGPAAVAARASEDAAISTRTAPAIIAGQRRMMRVADVPIPTIGVAGFATDIQELEDSRADFARFAAAQRDMLDRLSAAVVQFAADQTLVFYNLNFLRIFSLDPDWVIERPAFDRVLERLREVERAPEVRDFPNWRAERRQWFLAAEPIEESWALPGGIHLRVVAQPLPDGGLLLIFEDRTEHLQLASARDTLLRVRTAIFDNLFEAIGVFAADGRLHVWNNRFREVWDLDEETLVLHPRVDALAQSIAPLLVDPSRAAAIRELVRVATVERQQRSGRISMKDGRHFEFAAVPLPDGNALFTLLDVTASRGIEEALRDRNEALEAANSLKNAFVASMSYELRVPLTSIAGFAEMLAGGYAGALEPKARDYVDAILTAVQRLGTLIGDALDLSQSEAGNLPMATDRVDISPLVREAVGVATEAATSRGLTIVVDLGECGTVIGDRGRLRQCLDHLLRNAVAYTPSGGRVVVRCRCDSDWAEITVSDNGRGISPRQRERIFDRLSRVRAEAAEQDPDADALPVRAGLGLPLARQFVEAHGGTLDLSSELGKWTSVLVRLPLAPAEGGDV